jgi:NTE family protein
MSKAIVLGGGGPLAVAWECGVFAGLVNQGAAGLRPDFMLGTSAGAIVGAQLAAGRNPVQMAEAIVAEKTGTPPPGARHSFSAAAVAKLPELFAKSGSQAGRIEIGAYALAAQTPEDESSYVARMQRHIGIETWPDGAFAAVALDALSGEARMLDRNCGGSVAACVAASCALPGLSPPVTIGGRRYIDGGFRSATNADLLSGFDTILIISFRLQGIPGERMLQRASAQAALLQEAGVRVLMVSPDEAVLDAIGPNSLDVRRRPAVTSAGVAQGESAAAQIAEFWDARAG